MKAVIHVDEMEKWTMGVGNLKRLIAYCQDAGQPFELELVANGDAAPGVTAGTARELGLDEGLETVLAQGAVVCVCQGAMKGSGIAPEQLMAGVKIVPSGVCELVIRQQEGVCLRPALRDLITGGLDEGDVPPAARFFGRKEPGKKR